MAVEVKICGINSEHALEAAISAGADYVGFVFYPRSPRHVTVEQAIRLREQAESRIKTVALTVNAPLPALVELAEKLRPDFFQLHGDESPQHMKAIRAETGLRLIKAIKVGEADDVKQANLFAPAADFILFDARVPQTPASLPGGNGASFEWTWLRARTDMRNAFLSGGLSPENIRTAIAASGAHRVDVSSGVETAPGVKDVALIRDFIDNAKAAQTSDEAHYATEGTRSWN
jgi:phosphoribosylanthranilate isomerase